MRSGEQVDDATLLVAAAHDGAAFEAFYRRYVRRVAGFAAQRCASADDVADVVAQTFLRLIGAAERYDPARGEPAAFLLGIAANAIRELHRHRSRQQAVAEKLIGRDLLEGDETERVEAAIDATRLTRDLGPALDAVTPVEQEMLRLVAAGRTPTQAAAELGITPVAARVRLSRARRRVRTQLSPPSTTEETP
jgi:RNA polymerase sigma-70 factor (ECF subfamily)